MQAQPRATLQFPDAPKLALDVLIEQLVDRARDVQHSQGRLRALLGAIETLTQDPSLDVVLRNLVAAGCELTGAGQGTFEQLGPSDDRLAVTPPDQPPAGSLLAVAVHVHGQVYGTLHLSDTGGGQFSVEDHALVEALVLAAGTAIGNARLLEESRQQQRWLAASVEITSQLIADVGEDPLSVIARSMREIADADLVLVSLLTPDAQELVVQAAAGPESVGLVGRHTAVATSRLRAQLERGTPLLLAQDDDAPGDDAAPVTGPLMALPLDGAEGVRGVLSVIRVSGRQPFRDTDLTMAATFAGHASVALELADARLAAQHLAQSEDRARIARNLHDHVIQELFAIGLGLETTAGFAEPGGVVAQRIDQRVRDIDRTIRQIRTSIFELRGPLGPFDVGLRARLLQIGSDLSDALGFTPQMVFSGLVDLQLGPELGDDLCACVREALANVAKHAHASRAEVSVSVSTTAVTVVVIDDGVGYTPSGRLSGLDNLRTRAERRSGSFDISSAAGRGTIVTWESKL